MGRLRLAALALMTAAAAGCALPPDATPEAVTWGDQVPTPAPEALHEQQVFVPTDDNLIHLRPVSPTGAVVGVEYAFVMPHCGIASPIDVDGSFWDAVGVPPNITDFDGMVGRFRLLSATEAVFTSDDGRVLHLVRHDGEKGFRGCA